MHCEHVDRGQYRVIKTHLFRSNSRKINIEFSNFICDEGIKLKEANSISLDITFDVDGVNLE